MAPGLSKDETKQALKEALKEWLDEKYLQFGKWSLHAIGAAALVAIVGYLLKSNVALK